MVWVPAYLDLWLDDKAGLHHATRSIYLRLCHAARRARRDGLVPLPPDAATPLDGVWSIVRGTMKEVVTAIDQMTQYGMIAIEGHEDGSVVRVLAWENWVLSGSAGAGEEDAGTGQTSGTESAPLRRRGRPRKWTSEAERSRSRRATGNPTDEDERPEIRPETNPVATGKVTGYSTENVSGQFAVTGGVRGGDQSKSEQRTAKENKECARARTISTPLDETVAPPGGQLALPGGESQGVAPAPRKRSNRRPASPPTPVTEVRTTWQTVWSEAGMPGPAPWGSDAAGAAKTYLETPGASVDTARQAFLGMLRTPAGEWHRTHEGGRHATAQAALAGARRVEFTSAGTKWLAEKDRPRREPPPPDPVPQIYLDLAEEDRARGIVPPWERKKPASVGGGGGNG